MELFNRTAREDYWLRNLQFLDLMDEELIPAVPSTTAIADPGNTVKAIPVTQSGVCMMTTGASGETRTLANPPVVGMSLTLVHSVDGGGNAVVTAARAVNQTGNNTLTFGDAGDYVKLESIKVGSNLRWQVVANDGAVLSTV